MIRVCRVHNPQTVNPHPQLNPEIPLKGDDEWDVEHIKGAAFNLLEYCKPFFVQPL